MFPPFFYRKTAYFQEKLGSPFFDIFGHTHQYFEKEEEGVMFLNPGALKGRREWKTQTYMLIGFNDDGSIDIIKKRLWKG